MSRIETIPNDKLAEIFDVISQLPHTVFIKMDRAKIARNLTVPDNVYTMNWIPQYATLCKYSMATGKILVVLNCGDRTMLESMFELELTLYGTVRVLVVHFTFYTSLLFHLLSLSLSSIRRLLHIYFWSLVVD